MTGVMRCLRDIRKESYPSFNEERSIKIDEDEYVIEIYPDSRSRRLSRSERIVRIILGITATIFTVGCALFLKPVRDYFIVDTRPKILVISKKEQIIPLADRARRAVIGVALVISTLFLALFSRRVRALFTEKMEYKQEYYHEGDQYITPLGEEIYLLPDLYFHKTNSDGVSFGIIKRGAQREEAVLLPIIRSSNRITYTVYEEEKSTLLKTLFTMVQMGENENRSVIEFLRDPRNRIIQEKEFIDYLFERDEDQKLYLEAINSESLIDILDLIRDKQLGISEEAIRLLTRSCIVNIRPLAILKILYDINQNIFIESLKDRTDETSPYAEAILNGLSEHAEFFVSCMNQHNISLTKEEHFLEQAWKNNSLFVETEFLSLNHETQKKIFYAANMYKHDELVKKMKMAVFVNNEPLFERKSNLLARNMDIIQAKEVLTRSLQQLRSQHLLLTQKEFDKQLPNYDEIDRASKWILSNLQQNEYIKKVIAANELSSLKLISQIGVLSENQDLLLSVNVGMQPFQKKTFLKAYQEPIEGLVDRKLSLEEAKQLITLFEKVENSSLYFGCTKERVLILNAGNILGISCDRPDYVSFKKIEYFLEEQGKQSFLDLLASKEKLLSQSLQDEVNDSIDECHRERERASHKASKQNQYNDLLIPLTGKIHQFSIPIDAIISHS